MKKVATAPKNSHDAKRLFWYKKHWTDSLKERKSKHHADSEKQNSTAAYIVDDTGEPVDYGIACKIRAKARRIWKDLKQQGYFNDVATWQELGDVALMHYYAEMEDEFPDLRHCDSHWKSEEIATDNFPNWIKPKKKRSAEELIHPCAIKRSRSTSPSGHSPPISVSLNHYHA